MYLDDVATVIRTHIPAESLPEGDAQSLLLLYALLLRAKGRDVTHADVHDAWSAWMAGQNRQHASLLPYEQLPIKVRDEDHVFVEAIKSAAKSLGRTEGSQGTFAEVLFPSGPPMGAEAETQALELYKIMVQSSEGLVTRRQGVNTFFLTMNGALLTASGLIVQNSGGHPLSGLGIVVLSLAGVILCAAWRSLILSFGQLNRGKFQVIKAIERYLKAAIYAAEWEALDRGANPKVYRTFTSREIWVPNALLVLHAVSGLVALVVVKGWLRL